MDISPLRFELLDFRATTHHLSGETRVGMRIDQQWDLAESVDELTLSLGVTLEDRSRTPPVELAFCSLAARYSVPDIRENRNAIPDALYLWIGHSTYDVIRGVFIGRAEGTILEQIMLPLPPDQAFLPDPGLRTISVN
jgi:hypothetical protein